MKILIAIALSLVATQVQDGKLGFDGWNLCGVWFSADLRGSKTDFSVVARDGIQELA